MTGGVVEWWSGSADRRSQLLLVLLMPAAQCINESQHTHRACVQYIPDEPGGAALQVPHQLTRLQLPGSTTSKGASKTCTANQGAAVSSDSRQGMQVQHATRQTVSDPRATLTLAVLRLLRVAQAPHVGLVALEAAVPGHLRGPGLAARHALGAHATKQQAVSAVSHRTLRGLASDHQRQSQ